MKKSIIFLLIIIFNFSLVYGQPGSIDLSVRQIPYQIQKQGNFKNLQIRFFFSNTISKTPVSGRIILGFHKDLTKSINNPDIIDLQPTFAWDVTDWKPGESITLDRSDAICWKGDLDSLNGWYGVQAAFKTNKKARTLKGLGNAVTNKNIINIKKGEMCSPVDLLFNIPWNGPKPFKESEFIKEVNIKSNLLTDFYGEPDSIQASVILPRSYYANKEKKYPSVYVFGGWGSSHFDVLNGEPQKRYGMEGFGDEKIFIFVNHECRTGYHVFCSSETNGQREETFFQEVIPYIENQFRVYKEPQTRFLMGQSSGGWASLWLLLNYPDKFGGAFAGSPDPVDFTDFIGTNIYKNNSNMYYFPDGKMKNLIPEGSIKGLSENITVKDFTGLDIIAGWGEQIFSFDAAFSKKDKNGEPMHLFDWNTGAVNPDVAAYWQNHDLSKLISKFDKKRSLYLKGKIHIFVAENDPFGLNRPVQLFQKTLIKKGIDADIRFMTEGGHFIWNDDIRKSIHEDIDRIVFSAIQKK